jgi:hypothetical protein
MKECSLFVCEISQITTSLVMLLVPIVGKPSMSRILMKVIWKFLDLRCKLDKFCLQKLNKIIKNDFEEKN